MDGRRIFEAHRNNIIENQNSSASQSEHLVELRRGGFEFWRFLIWKYRNKA